MLESPMKTMASATLHLHGRSVRYLQRGSGPVLLLIHGMAGTLENWRAVTEPLAPRRL
jgi:pimeloyl-ACP methyl ester carboxylesterase